MRLNKIIKRAILSGVLIILCFPLLSWTSDPTDSEAITSIPFFEITNSVSFHSIHEDGDILFIATINLDEDGSYISPSSSLATTDSENWCLITSSDCDSTPIQAQDYSITKDLYTQKHPLEFRYVECSGGNCENTPSQQEILIVSIAKRIDHSLISLYKSSQSVSGITYGNTQAYLCLSPNDDVFPDQEKCLQVIPQGSTAHLSTFLVSQMRELEENLEIPENSLISPSQKITHQGRKYLDLAVPSFSLISCDPLIATILQFSASPCVSDDYGTDEEITGLQASLLTEYQATELDTNIDYFMNYTFGIDGDVLWHTFFIVISIISVFFFFYITRNGFFSVFSGIMAYSMSIFVVPTNLPMIFSIMALMSLLMGAWVVKRMGAN